MATNLNRGVLCAGVVMGLALSGCVSSRTHEETLAELEKARHAAAQQAAEDEASLADARRENERLVDRLEEIGKDKLSTQQLRDRLTITMVDRVLFESGSDRITAEGKEVLYKVSAVLKDARDKRILVSGHTDDIRIGPSLRARFKTNSGAFDGARHQRGPLLGRSWRHRSPIIDGGRSCVYQARGR